MASKPTMFNAPRVPSATLIVFLLLMPLVGGCASETSGETSGGTGTEAQLSPPVDAAGLAVPLPQGWNQAAPSSQMRALQAAIPGSGGPGELAVFFFGPGGGGGVDANLERWKGQVVPDPGAEAMREMFAADNGMKVTWIDSQGTLKASQIGSFPTSDMPDYRLFAAVVEGSGGPWFFKAVGPQQTMAEQRSAFLAMLKAVGS